MEKVIRKIDSKHHAEYDPATGKIEIIKTTNGQAVPEDEPMIIFRGRDYLSLPLLQAYRDMCVKDGCNDHQPAAVDSVAERFMKFATENPRKMKQPGVTRGL